MICVTPNTHWVPTPDDQHLKVSQKKACLCFYVSHKFPELQTLGSGRDPKILSVSWELAPASSSFSQLSGGLALFLISCAGDCPLPRLLSLLSAGAEFAASDAVYLSLVPPSNVSPLVLWTGKCVLCRYPGEVEVNAH